MRPRQRLLFGVSLLALIGARPAVAPHDLHVTSTRMVIEGTAIVARVRMFRDDLQKALKRPVGDDAASKAAVTAYLAQNFVLTAEGARLTGEVLDSGGELDGDQPIWWAIVQWKTAQPVKSLGVRMHVMFETFSDQQNTVLVARNPGDERRGLYFQAGDRTEQVIKF